MTEALVRDDGMQEQQGVQTKQKAGEPPRGAIGQPGRPQTESRFGQRTDETHQIANQQRVARTDIDETNEGLLQRQLICQENPVWIHESNQRVSAIDRRVQMDERDSKQQRQNEYGKEIRPVGRKFGRAWFIT
jgi:hypothetical protein